MKKKLNIHFSGNLVDENIVRFLKDEFEIEIINISANEINNPKQEILNTLKTIDLIIFTGGEDVNPAIYGEEVGKYTHINKKRDDLEFNLLHAKKIPSSYIRQIPKLGICRGAQLLTVYNGGRLIQHVEGHKNNNQLIDIVFTFGTKTIEISSDHHQMMFPFNLNKKDYELIGFSQKFQSNTYLNGRNEEIKLPQGFLEPEIVYYEHKKSLCIQGHPEWCIGSEGSLECIKLIKKYLLKDKNIKIESLPEGLPEGNHWNIGWNATDINGVHYKFDGEKFITREEFNSIGIHNLIQRKEMKKVKTWPVSNYISPVEKEEILNKYYQQGLNAGKNELQEETNNKIEF